MIPLVAAALLGGGAALVKKCFDWRRDEQQRVRALSEGTIWELDPTGVIEGKMRAELGETGDLLPYSTTFGAQGFVAWSGGLRVHFVAGRETLEVDVPSRTAFHCWSFRNQDGEDRSGRSPVPWEKLARVSIQYIPPDRRDEEPRFRVQIGEYRLVPAIKCGETIRQAATVIARRLGAELSAKGLEGRSLFVYVGDYVWARHHIPEE